jgi:uncharacterized protein YqjF (DUF2071 family)
MVGRTAEQHISLPVLRASWETMTFVHWAVPPELVQRLLPSGLTVDVYGGSAWVGLAPFVMANMRPLGMPDLSGDQRLVPGVSRLPRLAQVSSTPETNLRTYVRGPDRRDGVWFLTMDIGSAVLATALRTAIGAPYHHAKLALQRRGDTCSYSGSRARSDESYQLEVHVGEPMENSDLQEWLTGRWRAYTTHLGRLLVTPVEHEPWPLRDARLVALEQSLTDAVGLPRLPDPTVVTFSEGVRKVRIGRPTLVGR